MSDGQDTDGPFALDAGHGMGGAYAEGVQKAAVEKSTESQQLQSEHFAGARGGAITPPFSPQKLATLIELNTTHAKAGFSKARNVAGFGFEIVPHPEVDDPDDSQRKTAEDFWFGTDSEWQVGPSDSERATASAVATMAWADFEIIGWSALEVLTQTDGTPVGLSYIPAPSIRVRKDSPGFVQLKSGNLRYFGNFGDRYAGFGDDGDGRTFVDAETGESGPSVAGDVANEIIWKRNHTPFVEHYGTPDIVPAIADVQGAGEARSFNLDFFSNNTVPRMAVLVEGGELTEDARDDIRKVFNGMKDEGHRTAILEVQKLLDDPSQVSLAEDSDEVRIKIEPLTVGVEEDAAFLDYQHHTEHEILKAHDVPPVEAGTVESGAFSTDAEQQRKGYIETVIQPKQEGFAELFYETIHKALGVTDWIVEFQTQGYDTRLSDAEVAKTKAEAAGGMEKVDERRGWLGLDPLGPPLGDMLVAELGGMGAGGGVEEPLEAMVDEQVDDAESRLRDDFETEYLMSVGASAADAD